MYIEGASSSEGDITWNPNESLQLGTWTADNSKVSHTQNISGTFNEYMRITKNGVVEIGDSRNSSNHVGYLKLDTINNNPSPDACNNESEYGRLIVDPYSAKLFICMQYGWVEK